GPLAALGAPDRAARLLGASSALLEDMDASHQPGDQGEIDRMDDQVRDQLGEDHYQEAWLAGRTMRLEEAVSFALEEWDNQ
ncbi:MAG: hypothetical protein PHQ40_13630, partial [Anaerolineaceae bacterium]|nr:hypothetical protein [Anaerolineaceae bacterium]